MKPARIYRQTNLTAILCGVGALSGCAPHSPAVPPAAPAAARATLPYVVPRDSMQAAIAAVHSHPLYKQAEQACRERHYRQAAGLLERLGRSGLGREEAAFVQQQRVICLQDAGLTVPAAATSARANVPRKAPNGKTAAGMARPPASAFTLQNADCGPRALLLACGSLGVKTSLARLRQAAGTTAEGTSLAGLQRACHAEGLSAEGVQVSWEALGEVDPPALAYVNGNHFVAVLALQGRGETGTAVIHDPNKARAETVSQERLLRLCSGYLLLLHK